MGFEIFEMGRKKGSPGDLGYLNSLIYNYVNLLSVQVNYESDNIHIYLLTFILRMNHEISLKLYATIVLGLSVAGNQQHIFTCIHIINLKYLCGRI